MIEDLDARVSQAVKLFWRTRAKQAKNQGSATGKKDAGLRAAVTGGKHLDGFTGICRDLLAQAGLADAEVHWRSKKELPGYLSGGEELGPAGRRRGASAGSRRVQGAGRAVLRQQFQQSYRRGLGQRRRLVGGVSRRGVQALRTPLAWVRVHSGRLPSLASACEAQATALPGVSGIRRRLLCQTIRNTAHQASARATLRRSKPLADPSRSGATGRVLVPLGRTAVSDFCSRPLRPCDSAGPRS